MEKTRERLNELLREAESSINANKLPAAADKLREASSIEPNNARTKELWNILQKQEQEGPLPTLIQRWVHQQKEEDATEALRYLSANKVPEDIAGQAMKQLLKVEEPCYHTKQSNDDAFEEDSPLDELTASLLKNRGARRVLATFLKEEPMIAYDKIFIRGDDSTDAMIAVLLDQSSWKNEKDRIAAERDVYQLALAKLMDYGTDHPDRPMKAISRLLAAEASNLKGLTDSDGFDVILQSMDIRNPPALRSHGTLAASKLLEDSHEAAEQLMSKYVLEKVQKGTSHDLILAFSASATLFPMATAAAAQLFLTKGFLENLVPLINSSKSKKVEQAALELLNAACMDRVCREATAKNCQEWLQDVAKTATDSKRMNLASLVLVKISQTQEGPEAKVVDLDTKTQADLIDGFKKQLSIEDDSEKNDSIEGLAYATLQPKFKDELSRDAAFLQRLIKLLSVTTADKPSLFGGLTILSNLTAYRPPQTEEQRKLAELKAYANTSKPAQLDPLDDDKAVGNRCKRVLEAGVVPMLVSVCKNKIPFGILNLISQILLSLSREKAHRGAMAQQGAVKLCLHIYDSTASKKDEKDDMPPSPSGPAVPETTNEQIAHTVAHALARILISLDPAHVFNSSLPISSAVRPLISLLYAASSLRPTSLTDNEPRNLLPTFESLLALTNLSSSPSVDAAILITRLALPVLDDLLLSSHQLVQRATVELFCNLLGHAHVAEAIFPIKSTLPTDKAPEEERIQAQSQTRLTILLALTSSPDTATSLAAGGAIATLLSHVDHASNSPSHLNPPPSVFLPLILSNPKSLTAILHMCAVPEAGLQHRGAVCLQAVLADQGARASVLQTGMGVVRGLYASKVPVVREFGREILGLLGGRRDSG